MSSSSAPQHEPTEPTDGCTGSPWCGCHDCTVMLRHRPWRPLVAAAQGSAA